MKIKAEAKFLKHGPRKVRLVADLIFKTFKQPGRHAGFKGFKASGG